MDNARIVNIRIRRVAAEGLSFEAASPRSRLEQGIVAALQEHGTESNLALQVGKAVTRELTKLARGDGASSAQRREP